MANEIDLFQVMPGLTVSETELLEAEYLTTQILQSKYPDIDVREGTAIRDLTIRPSATLLALVNKALRFYFAQNTIQGVTDETPAAFVDKLMSNWFISRKSGTKSVINVRLSFARQKSISLQQDTFFSTNGTLKFLPATSFVIPTESLTFDAYNNEYYVDVDLTAENVGSDYNLSSGSLLYFSTFDPYFLHGEINYLKQTADDTETNTQFLERAQDAISTRNLINVPSISTKIREDFPIVSEVTSSGMGDSDMYRDQVQVVAPTIADPIWIHNGGMVDVYCRVPLTSSIIQVSTDDDGVATLTGPIYKIKRSSISGGFDDDTIPVLDEQAVTSVTRSGSTVTVTTTSNHGYSTGQEVTIDGANQGDYNGTFIVTVTGASTFTYQITGTPITPATGTISAGVDFPYTVSNPNSQDITLASVTRSGTTATATFANHGLIANRYVNISGANQSAYNGVKLVTSVTRDTFTFEVEGSPVTPATGTIICNHVIPQKDVGFSNRQDLSIDFGVSQANSTASFEIYFFQDIDGIQTYLEDSTRRVLCGDLLARGYNIYLLDASVTAYNVPAYNSVTISDIITEYLEGLNAGEIFVMSDVIAKLYEGGIKSIQNPISLNYTFYNRDLSAPLTGTITDKLNPEDRTAIFILNSVTSLSTNA